VRRRERAKEPAVPTADAQRQRRPTAGRWQGAERRRLLNAAERLRRRWQWAADQREAASDRLDALADELAIVTRQLDALEADE
jgi:hypothetical protein